jgi:two-component system cell cycle sensor histidine kinase/response regulator CckA
VLTDLRAGPGDLLPRIDTIAPFFAGTGETSDLAGAVVLQNDARQFLYPLIQSWPTPSDSAETLLVRRDGDDVLFLNDLRHQANTALTLRFPLSRTDLPMVMAALGREGVVQGVDYRGVAVLAALKAVPNSPWFLVAKVDAEEALSVWRRESALILALFLGLMLAATAATGVVWQGNQKAHYQALFQAEAARLASEARHRTTLLSVGDGVIVTDAEGRVELLNPVAEAQGRPLAEVFHIVNEETHQPVENPGARVLREGRVVGLANGSYDKAAILTVACAEVLRARGDKGAADTFVDEIRNRFPRHRAFQAELKTALRGI